MRSRFLFQGSLIHAGNTKYVSVRDDGQFRSIIQLFKLPLKAEQLRKDFKMMLLLPRLKYFILPLALNLPTHDFENNTFSLQEKKEANFSNM